MKDVQLSRYSYRSKDGWDYAIFVIGSDGYFSVISSYGNYSYFWAAPGKPFKEFLAKLDKGYVLDKLSYGKKDEYRSKETLAAVKAELSEDDEEELQLLEDYSELDDEADFNGWCAETAIEEPYQYHRSGTSYQLLGFYDAFFGMFQADLKKEI